jgi:hypothetical protein
MHVESELVRLGLAVHRVIYGCGNGPRLLVNDRKPYAPDVDTARAVCINRNEGIRAISLT